MRGFQNRENQTSKSCSLWDSSVPLVPVRQTAVRTGKRRRSAATKELSPLADTISSGENPLRHASQSVISNSAIVIKTFGHAFSPHCPCQTSRSDEENGARYEIGH